VAKTLAEEFLEKASIEQLQRIALAAHWYVICTIDGCRTDCAWFELESSVADVEPVEIL
jgi:hypothetical protein